MDLFKQEDTIVAPATPYGRSALAVIRISGKNSRDIVSSVFFDSKGRKPEIKNRTVCHGYICDGTKKIDEVVLFYTKAPHTYTGEDTVEISSHGNMVIVKQIISLLISKGARLADRGEYTYRAFINGKMELSQAEAVNDLINSTGSKSAELALSSLQGSLAAKVKEIKNDMTDLLAYLEVSLDYPEEDIDFLSRKEKEERLLKIINKTDGIIKTYSLSKMVSNGIKIAITGKPNAGKSSILNKILGYSRAIVTDIAGTTTDTIEESVEYKGIPFKITDTAGLREHSSDAIETVGQEKSKEIIRSSDIVLWITDSSLCLDGNDIKISEILKDRKDRTVAVLNKSDLPQKLSEDDIKNTCGINNIIHFSAVTDCPAEQIFEKIYSVLDIKDTEENSEIFLNARQYDLLCRTKNALNNILKLVRQADSDEIVAFEAKNVMEPLDEITGCNVKEDILHSVFSKFCVGK